MPCHGNRLSARFRMPYYYGSRSPSRVTIVAPMTCCVFLRSSGPAAGPGCSRRSSHSIAGLGGTRLIPCNCAISAAA